MARHIKKYATSKSEKHYTFIVSVSFDMQFTFREDEVEPAEEGGEGDFDPTEKALSELEQELKEYLAQSYPIETIEASADFDSLLGVSGTTVTHEATGKAVRKSALEKRAKQRRTKPRL